MIDIRLWIFIANMVIDVSPSRDGFPISTFQRLNYEIYDDYGWQTPTPTFGRRGTTSPSYYYYPDTRVFCQSPSIPNARLSFQEFYILVAPNTQMEQGDQISVTCKDGYVIVDEMYSLLTCDQNSEWRPFLAAEVCKKSGIINGCNIANLKAVQNGRFQASAANGYSVGSSTTLVCDPGYQMTGSSEAICQSNGAWAFNGSCTPEKKIVGNKSGLIFHNLLITLCCCIVSIFF